jgi:hypothetical protein
MTTLTTVTFVSLHLHLFCSALLYSDIDGELEQLPRFGFDLSEVHLG